MSRRLITDVAAGTKTRKESNIAEKADVLGVCLIGKRIPSGSYRAVCSGSVVRNLSKFNSEKVFVITSDIIVGGRQSGQNTLITKDYRLYFKKWDSTNELKVYELHEVTSSKENDNIHLISGLAIIPIDAKKLRRRSGILKYRPFTSEETECSSLGGSVCQIVAGNTDAFAVTPYDLENDSGEYVLKLPEKGISFKTWTELTGGGANSSSLHPRGAVFLRHGKAVGFLTFLNGSGKIAPVCSSHSLLQAGSGTDVTTTNQEGIEAGTSAMVSEDLDVFTQQNVDVDGADEASSDSARQNLSDTEEQGPSRSTASGQQGSKGSDVTTTNQEGIKAGTSAMVSEDLDVHTQQNVDDEPLIYRRRRDSADFPGIPGITADVRSKGRGRGTLTDIPGTTEVRGRGRGASKMEKPTQYNGRESIRIEEQPSSQKQKEGSRVELRCKIQGRNDVTYQWLKDGEDLKGQNSATLVLNPVQLCDFGFYVCKVRCTDNSASSICVESSPAELNVTPRDGMRFKQLSEIRLTDAGDRLEKQLSLKIHGLGGWKQVAMKFKMDKLNIKLLEEGPQIAGATVLTYVEAHNPDLTVYEFCKILKEPNIRRHDIVKGLLDHLSVTL